MTDHEGRGGSLLPSDVTVEHIECKHSKGRLEKGTTRTVAACYKCNHERGQQTDKTPHGSMELALMRIQELKRRAISKGEEKVVSALSQCLRELRMAGIEA